MTSSSDQTSGDFKIEGPLGPSLTIRPPAEVETGKPLAQMAAHSSARENHSHFFFEASAIFLHRWPKESKLLARLIPRAPGGEVMEDDDRNVHFIFFFKDPEQPINLPSAGEGDKPAKLTLIFRFSFKLKQEDKAFKHWGDITCKNQVEVIQGPRQAQEYYSLVV
jgi:hypothetical protein